MPTSQIGVPTDSSERSATERQHESIWNNQPFDTSSYCKILIDGNAVGMLPFRSSEGLADVVLERRRAVQPPEAIFSRQPKAAPLCEVIDAKHIRRGTG